MKSLDSLLLKAYCAEPQQLSVMTVDADNSLTKPKQDSWCVMETAKIYEIKYKDFFMIRNYVTTWYKEEDDTYPTTSHSQPSHNNTLNFTKE